MLESLLKPTYTKLLVTPLSQKLLIPNKITPNQITVIGMILGILAGLTISLHLITMSIILIILSGHADIVDGNLARLSQQQTPFGCMLDIIGDRVVEASIIIGLYFYSPNQRATLTLFMLASVLICVTSFLVASLFKTENNDHQEKSFLYSRSLIERAEAFLFFIGMVIFPNYFNIIAIIFVVLVLFSAMMHLITLKLVNPSQMSSK